MRQTWALVLDAYRDLNARKIFWIVLILSTLMATSSAAVGLTPNGFTIFWKEFFSRLNSRNVAPALFYKFVFLYLGLQWWLGFFATLLALLSTASIFPDILSSGAIDLYLSKPISRLRLFITKYLCGMIFVTLQITVFCLASFFVIGIRGKEWEPGVFMAIPLVVLFYSYLYSVCTLVGVVSRSTITALLVTILFWAAVFGVHFAETQTLAGHLEEQQAGIYLNQQILTDETALERMKAPTTLPSLVAGITPTTDPTTQPSLSSYLPGFLRGFAQDTAQSRLETKIAGERIQQGRMRDDYILPHRISYAVMTFLPKTAETIDLLQRQLVVRARLTTAVEYQNGPPPPRRNRRDAERAAEAAMQVELSHRTVSWVVGTSVGFELLTLTLAAVIFCRRDY
ncbi:MAG: hypothetical protein M3O30_19430 [Planctomycetota bacterium]|nr:hypothetical protein [Planctomycetota bacterium]